jgi:hypothetical protein
LRREQLEPEHGVYHPLQPHRVDAKREGRQRDEGRDTQVLSDSPLHSGAVGVGDLVPGGDVVAALDLAVDVFSSLSFAVSPPPDRLEHPATSIATATADAMSAFRDFILTP